jgi:hypothetical protein
LIDQVLFEKLEEFKVKYIQNVNVNLLKRIETKRNEMGLGWSGIAMP